MEIERKKFQGVLNIISFNRHFYYYGVATLLLILLAAHFLDLSPAINILIILGFIYGLLTPLIISAFVYDYSGFYNFDWLDNYIEDRSKEMKVVNINAGFDETSFIIKSKLKNADLEVYDFYDEDQHTEPAIVRARKVSLTYPNTKQIESNAFPSEDNSADIIFLLSSVHEIREFGEKVEFLKECLRICKPKGKIIMVEHLRDLPNFLAFTIGFTHFFSRSVWKKAFSEAGFKSFKEKKFTPYMSIFECTL